MSFVKICCIASREEAWLAAELGADALGLVSHMPSGPGVIADALIADIAAYAGAQLPRHLRTYLLTSRQTAAGVAEQHALCQTTTIQLVDELAPQELRLLRQLLPQVELVQVIHVVDDDSVRQAMAVASLVDQLLLDSGNQKLPVKQLGGTGRTHDWALSARIVAQAGIPVLLAGGLNAANARAALASVGPHGLDICSGVRSGTSGASTLDAVKLAAFMTAVKG
jgi:phosphoribosylanthranilate isomerase